MMTAMQKRWCVGPLAAALLAGTVVPSHAMNVFTEILIEAEPESIWATLTDLERYPVWNPYHVQVGGELAKGKKLDLVIHKPNGKVIEIRPRVMRIERNRALVWGGGVPLIFTGQHVFELELVKFGCTRLIHRERFSGLLVGFLDLSGIEEGYTNMNENLKAYVEQGFAKLSGYGC
jgi:hypothetical protein